MNGVKVEWHSLKPHGGLLLCGDFRGRHAAGRLAEEMNGVKVHGFTSQHQNSIQHALTNTYSIALSYEIASLPETFQTRMIAPFPAR